MTVNKADGVQVSKG